MSGPSWRAANGEVHGAAAFYTVPAVDRAWSTSDPQKDKKSLAQALARSLARHRQALVVLALLAGLVTLQLALQSDAWGTQLSQEKTKKQQVVCIGGDQVTGDSRTSSVLIPGSSVWSPEEKEVFLQQISNCSSGAEEQMKEYFQDVVLIVNNNYDKHALNTTKFWRRFYQRLFRDVVFISAKGNPDLGIEAALSYYPDAPDPWWGTWMYHFWSLRRIMKRYPEAAGFLWTNDDVVVNYWRLVGADKTKLWLPNNPEKYEYHVFELDPSKEVSDKTWGNWASRVQYRKQVKITLGLLENRYLEQYNASVLPQRNVYNKRGCDLFYIPQRHARALIDDLLPAVEGGHLMSELAIPFMFFALDLPQDFDPILHDMVYRWDLWREGAALYQPEDHWVGNISGFHPWKISSRPSRLSMVQAMSKWDGCLATQNLDDLVD